MTETRLDQLIDLHAPSLRRFQQHSGGQTLSFMQEDRLLYCQIEPVEWERVSLFAEMGPRVVYADELDIESPEFVALLKELELAARVN